MSYLTVPVERLIEVYLEQYPPASYEEYSGFKMQIQSVRRCAVEIEFKMKPKKGTQ